MIVPVLNEERNMAPFLGQLALQLQVELELIFSDGGSADDTVGAAARLAEGLPFPVRVVGGVKGRGAQMNLGADLARAPALLFLHIDSRLPDPLSLRKGLDALGAASLGGDDRVAGRFALQFDFADAPPLPYRFYGAKATLDRPGCTHGDQGFLIGSDFFRAVSRFPERLPCMEDTLLAERVRLTGRWLLFPAVIKSSPRRFLAEGLLPRQTLNAVLMNLAAIGRLALIEQLAESYPSQQDASRLRVRPFLASLTDSIALLPAAERRRLWRQTGAYVRSNAWQIAFFLDLLTGGVRVGKGGRFLDFHDRFLERLLDNTAGDWAAAALVRLWLALTLAFGR